MPNYQVTVRPGRHAPDCECQRGGQIYNITADTQFLAITIARNHWGNERCPNPLPNNCQYDRDQLIIECGYAVEILEPNN